MSRSRGKSFDPKDELIVFGKVHFVKITVKITPPPWLALPLIEQKYHFVQLLSVRLKTASTYFDKVSFPF